MVFFFLRPVLPYNSLGNTRCSTGPRPSGAAALVDRQLLTWFTDEESDCAVPSSVSSIFTRAERKEEIGGVDARNRGLLRIIGIM